MSMELLELGGIVLIGCFSPRDHQSLRFSAPNPSQLQQALSNLDQQAIQLQASKGRIEEALRIVESLRGETRSPALRASFLAVSYDFFEMAIDLLMQLDSRKPGRGFSGRALEVSERARARSLLEGVAAARSRAPVPPAIRERERVVRAELAKVEQLRRFRT